MVREASASEEWRKAVARARHDEPSRGKPRDPGEPAWQPDVWVEDEPKPTAARRSPPAPRQRKRLLPAEVASELVHIGGARRASSWQRTMSEATRAFEAERYQDALRLLAPLAEAAPTAGSVRELYGLTLYRLGRWKAVIRELGAAHRLTGSFDQHPVLADSQRALGRYKAVAETWEELRRASPSGDVVAEGRIVMAGSLADRGEFGQAIALLEPFGVNRARPRLFHLRTWYALADLYERGGDVPRARELFRRLVKHDANFHDVVERLAAL